MAGRKLAASPCQVAANRYSKEPPMPPAKVQLRPFTLADAPVVAGWLDGPGISAPSGSLAGRWATLLEKGGRARAFVATRRGVPVGFARLDVGPDRVAELTVAVARPSRRTGVGAELLSLVMAEAKSLRILRLQAVVDVANAPATAFFAKAGFEERSTIPGSVTFVRWLHDAEAPALDLEESG